MRPWYSWAVLKNLTPPEVERFTTKFEVDTGSGCWMWTGPLDRDGYGMFYLRRKTRRAHRVAWFSAFGDLPKGMVVNHVCRQRACVNPQHLNVVTPSENALRDSRSRGYVNSQKTHCPRGHSYDGTFTNRQTGKSYRTCSVCEREKKRRLRKKWVDQDPLNV